MRILIAEDEATTRLLLAAVLRKNGFDVVEAENGAEAWAVLQRPDAPSLAILDWMMPEMDGLEVVRRVRARPAEHPPYLVMLTARGDKADLVAGLDAGANDYLAKPFDPGELRARVSVGRRMVEMQDELKDRNEELFRWRCRMDHELKLAGQVQRNLLSTRSVFVPAFDVRFAYRPSMSIGGDFFDALVLPDGRLCLYVGDVSGHGVAPALISTFLKMRTSDLIREHIDAGPAAVCRAMNRNMNDHNLGTELYATLFLALFDPETGRWRACNCGHPMPILLRADGSVAEGAIPDVGDLPLGVANRPDQYGRDSEVEWTGRSGDVLMMFTDGTYESIHAQTKELCGRARFEALSSEVVRRHPELPDPDEILECLAERGYQIEGDDCCVVTVRATPPGGALVSEEAACTLMEVDRVSSLCEQRLRKEGWPEPAAMGVRLLVSEYVANVVRHGGVSPSDSFHCEVSMSGDCCRVFVRDPGRSWNFLGRIGGAAMPALNSENGRGLALIQAIAKQIDFSRMERYNYARFTVERGWTGGSAEQ